MATLKTPKVSYSVQIPGDDTPEGDYQEEDSGADAAAAQFLHHIHCAPWGVLGLQFDSATNQCGLRAPEPHMHMAIVDPTSLATVQGQGPRDIQSGVGVAIYRRAGIEDDAAFPAEVVSALTADFQAVLQGYGEDLQVIHVAAPDLRRPEYEDETTAVEALTESYCNIMRVFSGSGLTSLRLLPLFPGLSRHRFSTSLPSMMIGAIGAAFTNLDSREQQRILNSSIELCIYAEVEFSSYSEHLMRLQKAMEGYLPAPSMSPLQAALMRSLSWESGGPRRSPHAARSPPSSSPCHRPSISPTATPGGTATQFRRLANEYEITEEDEVPEMYGTHEMPLTEEQMHYALEPRLGDRPGTGHCLLRTNAEGGGAPTSRPPPPDISALSSMEKLRAKAKQRVGGFVLSSSSSKLRRSLSFGRKADPFRRTAEKVIVPDEEPWEVIRFDPDWKSSTVDLLEEHRVASWSLSLHGGMAMSRQLVRRSAIGRYFEVQIDFTDDAVWSDGIGIGVAVKAAKGAAQNVAGVSNFTQGYACELLPLSWLVGYDGRAKICGFTRYLTNAEMPHGPWKPSSLQSGDILALLVTESGTMMLFVNDVLRVIVQSCEDLDRQWKGQLHAVIDLDGCTRSVRFLDTNGLPSREVSLLYASLKQVENAARLPISFDEKTN